MNEVLEVAASQIGEREVGGNNQGPQVERYLAAVGLGPGQPWCAAFVAWCFQQARVYGWPATGDTWALRDWAHEHGAFTSTPSVGDVFLLIGPDGQPSHTGFVTGVEGDSIATIEGNTGIASDTDGDGVAAKHRAVSDCRFIRWQPLLLGPRAECIKIFWHDGRGACVVDGVSRAVKGVKVNGVPWAGGEILVGL